MEIVCVSSCWRLPTRPCVCVCREKKKKGGCLFLKRKKIIYIILIPSGSFPVLFLSFHRRLLSPPEVHVPIQVWEEAWNSHRKKTASERPKTFHVESVAGKMILSRVKFLHRNRSPTVLCLLSTLNRFYESFCFAIFIYI